VKEVRSIIRRQHEKSYEFIERYRYRAGVEAAISQYDRKTGVKRLRYRGLESVSFAAKLKALGVNIFRASKVIVAIGEGISPKAQPFPESAFKQPANSTIFYYLSVFDKICGFFEKNLFMESFKLAWRYC